VESKHTRKIHMDTIVTGFLLGLGLTGALMFVANIGWRPDRTANHHATQATNERTKNCSIPVNTTRRSTNCQNHGQPHADPGPRPHRRQNASEFAILRLDHLWLACSRFHPRLRLHNHRYDAVLRTGSISADTRSHPSSPPLVMPCFCFSPWPSWSSWPTP
jgi:hypothetical protein